MAQRVVFYSWQSWTDKGANWSFIQDCLERAIKTIAKDEMLRLDPVMDRDTRGRPGSPDIAETIFDKIEDADVFVADVSLVCREPPTPNPNVLVELGYALAKLGKAKVLCVHNLATGPIEDLPFDIRPKRIIPYELRAKEDTDAWRAERGEVRQKLVATFETAIADILSATDPEVAEFVSHFVTALHNVIIFGEQINDRQIKPGSVELRVIFEATAQDLRKWMARSIAESEGLREPMATLAAALEEIVHDSRSLNSESHKRYVGLIESAVALASTIIREKIGNVVPNRHDKAMVHRLLFEKQNEVQGIVDRLPSLMQRPGGLDETYQTVSSIGYTLGKIAQYDLDRLQAGLSERLRPLAKRLHLVGISLNYHSGPQRARMYTATELSESAAQFRELVLSLPPPK